MRTLYIIVILMIAMGAIFSQTKKCAYCKKEITSEYIEVEGKYYHPEHFLCAACGKPIKESRYYTKDGKFYHSACFDEQVREKCALCGKPLKGEYIIFEGKKYHKHCYHNEVALRCDLCGKVIEGKYASDYWGNNYCLRHQHDADKCDFCGRYISRDLTGGGYKYSDATKICALCFKSAVDDMKKARPLLKKISDLLKLEGIEVNIDEVDFNLAGQEELDKISSDHYTLNKPRGFTNYQSTTLDGRIISEDYDIYLLYGMEKNHFIATAAHELMHVWLYKNGPEDSKGALVEGSCNYAAWLVLQYFSEPETEHVKYLMMENPDKIYGDGFRKVKKMAEERGKNYWLRYIRKNSRF